MTDLTDKWKKGELKEGHYYVRDGKNIIAELLDGYFYNNGEPITSFSGGVDEVLAPVPSYEKNLAMQSDSLAKNEGVKINAELEAENSKLKTEYEKECHRADELEDSYWKAEKENQKLKKQLAIAKDFIFRCANDISGDWYINSAKCVLKQIEELDK